MNELRAVSLNADTCRNAAEAMSREWLVTNGLGGWASGTLANANTRRYHGALVAALKPPVARTVLVSKLDDWATYAGAQVGLTTNEFADGTLDPQGYRAVWNFSLIDGLPHWEYRFGDAVLHKTIFMPYGHNASWTVYHFGEGTSPLVLNIKPLLNHRDSHSETRADNWRPSITAIDGGIKVELFDAAHPIYLLFTGGNFVFNPHWVHRLHFRAERARGLPDTEDVFGIGHITATLAPGDHFAVLASAEQPVADTPHWRIAQQHTVARHRALIATANLPASAPNWVRQLVLAADQFVVARTDSGAPVATNWRGAMPADRTLIAGYHWFTDWGRDTMIALPGLTLSTRRFDEAADILRTFSRHISEGMLPNRFPDSGETPEYNTVDATLWYFHAVERYTTASGDLSLARALFAILDDIIGWHLRGTRHQIHCDAADGLLYSGEPGVQLTWMDAKVDDWVVTPRTGKAVEINALWINALWAMDDLAQRLNIVPARDYRALAERAAGSFDKFWFDGGGYLYDVIDSPMEGNDRSLRPNQLFAIALPFAPVEPSSPKAHSILTACENALLAPCGLRSLSPDHQHYRPSYGGDRYTRDGAYHQGAVWGWLLGVFVEAHLKTYGDPDRAAALLQPVEEHLPHFGMGSIAEVYDGSPPFKPEGCIAQAWSVSEALRLWRLVHG